MAELAINESPGRIIAAIRRIGASPLFRRDAPITSTRAAFDWWEARRIPYNLVVGGAGIFTCAVFTIIGLASHFFFNSDFGLPDPPLFAIFMVFLYAFLANVCYSAGWAVELIVRKAWPGEADRFAIIAFSLGLAGSALLTLVPAIVIGAIGFLQLVSRLTRSI
jgi:hypothetical protein